MTTLPLRLKPAAILDYLDTAICTWSAIKNQYSKEILCKLLPKVVLEITIAELYIHAFQSMRIELFGHSLSEEAIAQVPVTKETIKSMGAGGTFSFDSDALIITGANGTVARYEPAKHKSGRSAITVNVQKR